MKKKSFLGPLLLVTAAMIWGLSFVFQRTGMDHIGPFSFGALRNALSALCLLPFALRNRAKAQIKESLGPTIKWGILCGSFLFAGGALQQIGLIHTTAGKAGFITALYIVLVPLLGGILLKEKVSGQSWFCVLLALIGFYLLSIQEGFSIEQGDLLVFIGVFFWAGHILLISRAQNLEPLMLSMMQMLVASIIYFVVALFIETFTMEAIRGAAVAIIYTGVFSGALGFTLQIFGQRYTDPTISSLLMSLESVFAVAAGYLLLNELLTSREAFGALIIFVAVILAQIPLKERKKSYE